MKKQGSTQAQAPVELDEHALSQVTGGYLGPDQSIHDFPPWVLPRIRPELRLDPVALQKAVGR